MLKIHTDAQKLINEWTESLEVVTIIQPFPDTIMTVAKDDHGLYHVTAYFTLGGVWHVSVDAQGVGADQAFKEIGKRLSQ
jgi:hypothetical protein